MQELMETFAILVYVLAAIAVPIFVVWFALRLLRALERSAQARERIARALEEEVKLRAEQRAFGSGTTPPDKW